jgi:hypothetical protein
VESVTTTAYRTAVSGQEEGASMYETATTLISENDARGLAEKMVSFAQGLSEGERSLYWAALHGRIAPEAAEVSGYIIVACAPLTEPELFRLFLSPAVGGMGSG